MANAEVDEAATVKATVVEVAVVMLNDRNCMLEVAAGDRMEHGVVVACPVAQTVVVAHPLVFAKVERGNEMPTPLNDRPTLVLPA